jgi:hypothetical protein
MLLRQTNTTQIRPTHVSVDPGCAKTRMNRVRRGIWFSCGAKLGGTPQASPVLDRRTDETSHYELGHLIGLHIWQHRTMFQMRAVPPQRLRVLPRPTWALQARMIRHAVSRGRNWAPFGKVIDSPFLHSILIMKGNHCKAYGWKWRPTSGSDDYLRAFLQPGGIATWRE